MNITITYMSGAGNLFSVIEGDKLTAMRDKSTLAKILCNIESGIKTEGLLIVNKSHQHDFEVDFYNPDGSHSMMCGNGGRCAVRFSIDHDIVTQKDLYEFSMASSVYKALAGNNIKLFFPEPKKILDNLKIEENPKISGRYIDNGSDHFVILSDMFNTALYNIDIMKIAPALRFSKTFEPHGANINFYELDEFARIKLRTYERGVEAETGACGTGALATAISAYLDDQVSFPVEVIPTSGIPLVVNAEYSENHFTGLSLEGPAEYIGLNQIEI